MFKVLAYGATHVGRERKNNEDSFRVDTDAGLYVVCDGMGGHASGEIASQLASDAMVRFIRDDRFRPEFRWPAEALHLMAEEARALDAAVRMANVEVYAAALANPTHKGMGTTIAGILAGPQRLGLVHVGDSRIYRLRGTDFEQLTDDHSLLNHYMRTRPMTAQQIRTFSGKNVIVRAVGLRDAVEPDVQVQDYRGDDVYLLCSDGLTDMVEDDTMARVIAESYLDLAATGQRLIELALEGGGRDNISLVLLRVVAGAGASATEDTERNTQSMRPMEDTSPGFDINQEHGSVDVDTLTEFPPPGAAAQQLAALGRPLAQTQQLSWRPWQRTPSDRRVDVGPTMKSTDRFRRVTPSELAAHRDDTQLPLTMLDLQLRAAAERQHEFDGDTQPFAVVPQDEGRPLADTDERPAVPASEDRLQLKRTPANGTRRPRPNDGSDKPT